MEEELALYDYMDYIHTYIIRYDNYAAYSLKYIYMCLILCLSSGQSLVYPEFVFPYFT